MIRRWLPLLFVGALFAQEAEEVEEIAFSVAGQVVTDAGRPCANVQVHVWDALADDRPLAHGRADDEGRFSLDVTRTAAARRDHAFGPVRVVARAAGRGRVSVRAPADSRDLKLIAARPGKWEGVLTGDSGKPLPGAPVRALQGDLEFNTTTDETGRFSIVGMAAGEAKITLRAAGHETRLVHAASGERLEVSLKRVPIVRGRLVDADSQRPIAGAHVVSLEAGTPVGTDTDSDGAFGIELRTGARIAVYADGYAVANFEVGGGGQEFALHRADPVGGEVRDELGEPVAFAALRLDPGFGDSIPGRTDAAGAFRFAVGVRAFAFVHIARRGYLPARATYDGHMHARRLQIDLQRGRAVRGIATLAGSPRAGIEIVLLHTSGPRGWKAVARAYTDRKGRFRLPAAPARATHARALIGTARSVAVPIAADMRIGALAKLRLHGFVRDDAGAPIAGLRVVGEGTVDRSVKSDANGRFDFGAVQVSGSMRLHVEHYGKRFNRLVQPGDPIEFVFERPLGPHTLTIVNRDRRSVDAEVVLTGADLRRVRSLTPAAQQAHFESLAPGRYEVQLNTAGYLPTKRMIVVGEALQQTETIELIRAGTLWIRATAGARMFVQTLEGEPAPVVSTRLKSDRERFAGFGPGRYRLMARAKGELIAIAEVEVGASDAPRDVDLVGGAASTLAVTVTGGDGKPVLGAALEIFSIGGFRFATGVVTDAEGQATLPRLIRGHIRVVATLGDARVDKGLAVEPGQSLSLALELR